MQNLINSIKAKLTNANKNNQAKTKIRAYSKKNIQPIWMNRDYGQFADEAYRKNVIAHRCINMLAQTAASVHWNVYQHKNGKITEICSHPLSNLLKKPHPNCAGAEFFENIYSYKLISGNAYILVIKNNKNIPVELYSLRPDRVQVIPSDNLMPAGYRYQVDSNYKDYMVDKITGQSNILHIKNFHPMSDFYGLSPIEAAAYSIDQHNNAAMWNQSLLQNGARPSGALIYKARNDNMSDDLSQEQFEQLKGQIEENFSGSKNSGKPLLLTGGLEWQEMSMSNKDMDFMEAKHSSAREIALAFGVPPQLLGIRGDNTYSNMQEARLALWEETIMPMLDHLKDALNNWLVPMYHDENIYIDYDRDQISALSPRRDNLWQRVNDADFLSINEKREILGFSALSNVDSLNN
jgi:HK97 family phage portal protein